MAKQQLKFKIRNISVEGNADVWQIKMKSSFELTEAKRDYSVAIEIDESFFNERIDEINQRITGVERQPDMFENGEGQIKEYKNQIKEIEREKRDAEKMEIEEFVAVVKSVDFEKNLMILEVAEDIVLNIIGIRKNLDAYLANLK